MMGEQNIASGVTVSNLTFDGNRYGFGTGPSGALSCLGGNALYFDLNLTGNGSQKFTLYWLDFINAPSWALEFGGYGSSVSVSNFGQGGYGIGPAGGTTPGSELAAQSATRSTAIEIRDSNNGAWYNNISYAGTAGITLDGSIQSAYGNRLYNNRYEISDGAGGGQLVLNGPGPNLPGLPQASYAQIAGNVINGNGWPAQSAPYSAPMTGCSLGVQTTANPGMEVYGFGHVFYNNEVYNATGEGMVFTGPCQGTNIPPTSPACPVGQITISGVNYFDTTDTPKYIENNGMGGIVFRSGTHTCTGCQNDMACGVTLDNLPAVSNAGYGISLDGVTNDTTHTNPINGGYYTGFINGSCLTIPGVPNNALGPTSPPSWTSLTISTPPNGYTFYMGGASCPQPMEVGAVPALSHIPGWMW